MILYLVHIKKYTIHKRETNKRFFPVDKPLKQDILVQANDDFPTAFVYYSLKSDDFFDKSKVLAFRSIKKMFLYFSDKNIEVGTTLYSFYKTKGGVPMITPPEGVLIYEFKNINIFASRII